MVVLKILQKDEQPRLIWAILGICTLLPLNSYAEDKSKDSGTEQQRMLSIASGHPVRETISPGVTSVLTSEDIDRIGARRVTEVLEYLPGIHISGARDGVNVIGIRGVYSESNQQVLLMVNGIPLRDGNIGGKPFLWDMPVKNISRIEVIRGPGSMLYGGDATVGVINIILKTGEELKGGDAGGFAGSNDTYEGWSEYGKKIGDWEYGFAFQGGSTTGNRGFIAQDSQTLLDRQFGTQLSNAPGFTNNGRDDYDARLNIAYKETIRFRAGYQGFNNVQTGEGAVYALDNLGQSQSDIFTADLTSVNSLAPNFNLETKAWLYHRSISTDFYFYPPGTFGGALPLGANIQAKASTDSYGVSTQADFSGFKNHEIIVGTGLIYTRNNPFSNKTNFIITPNFVSQIPLTEQAALGITPIAKVQERYNVHVLLQDEWNFLPDWYLTTGLRYDYYSDVRFGLSPRVSLVKNFNLYTTAKLLYGRSFRPPSFFELDFSDPVLKPETANTVEFQIEKKWSRSLKTRANIYWFEFDNFISSQINNGLTPVNFENNPTINGTGVDSEIFYTINDSVNIALNYSFNGISNTVNNGFLPEHSAKALANWEFLPGWRLGTQLDWVGERRRPINDPRPNLSSYFILGLTLSGNVTDRLEFTVRVNNLTGAAAKEPSLSSILLPGDVPVLNRYVLGQIKLSF